MLQQPGCSVGDKMSVAECGLGCHMEWLIMEGFFPLISQIKCSTPRQHSSAVLICDCTPKADIFLSQNMPAGCPQTLFGGAATRTQRVKTLADC